MSVKYIYIFCLMVLMLSYQNCEYSSQIKIKNNNWIRSQSVGGNGGGYDGKILVYNHIVPGFECEGKPAPHSVITVHQNGEVTLVENRKDKCSSLTLTLKDFDQSKYNLELLGYRERIYEFEKEDWIFYSQNYKEAWCKANDEVNEKFDISIEYRKEPDLAYSQFYFNDENNKPFVTEYNLINKRNIQKNTISYESTNFNLNIDRSKPAPEAWWFFPATFEGLVQGKMKKIKMSCRVATGKLLGVVQKTYAHHGQWSQYIKSADPKQACDGSEQNQSDCVHAGEKFYVETNEPNCKLLKIEDQLGVFDWRCHDDSGYAHFETIGLKYKKGLRDLVVPYDWKENFIRIYKIPENILSLEFLNWMNYQVNSYDIIYESLPQKWWINPVLQLPNSQTEFVNLKNGDSLLSPAPVYVITESIVSKGLFIDGQDGISIVSLLNSKLYSSDPLVCLNNDCGSFYKIPNMIYSENSKFQWFEVDLDGNGGSGGVLGGALLNFHNTSWNRIHNSSFANLGIPTGPATYGLFMYKSKNHIISDSEFHNLKNGLVSGGYSVNSMIRNTNVYDNSFHGIDFEVGDNNLVIQNNIIKNNKSYGFEMRGGTDLTMSAMSSIGNSVGVHLDLEFNKNSLVVKSDLSNNNNGFYIDRIVNGVFADLKILNSTWAGINIQSPLVSPAHQYLGSIDLSGSLVKHCSILNQLPDPIISDDLCLSGKLVAPLLNFNNPDLSLICEKMKFDFIEPSGRSRFLRSALEILGDGLGNENGLCEAGEDCYFSDILGADLSKSGFSSLPVCKISEGPFVNTIIRLKY